LEIGPVAIRVKPMLNILISFNYVCVEQYVVE